MARILVAEDDAAVQTFVRRALVHRGHEVTSVDDGSQALDALGAEPFDLLITDIVMPGHLQGPGLARELRGLNPDLPVIFMSGYARESTVHGNGLRESEIGRAHV